MLKALLLLSLTLSSSAFASTIPDDRAVNAIIGEAEGEGYEGMKAVACAIRNRGTLKGVYGEKSPRVINKKYSQDVWLTASTAWVMSKDKEICDELIGGATHWEGTAFKTPYWAHKMTLTATVRNQRFYK